MSLRALDPLLQTDESTLHTEFVAHFYELITQSIQPPYAISMTVCGDRKNDHHADIAGKAGPGGLSGVLV